MGKITCRLESLQTYKLAFLILLFATSLVLRLVPLGRYVTPDEPAWVYRSIRFADALTARDWSAVPSTGHPGVTTMWLGAAGVAVRRLLSPAESAGHLSWIRRLAWLAPENSEAFRHLAFFLPYGRAAVALTTSLALVAVYWLLKRLLDRRAAFLSVGLLAFDPFLVGHSGLLHTDALLATLSTLSLLCLLIAVRDGRRSGIWALASGTAGGLGLLTKSLGGYLVLFTGIVLGSAWLLRRIKLSQAISYAALWGLAGVALYAALYPAMWGRPLETVRDLLAAPAYQSTTALMPTFFAGRTALRHGPEFYLVALPFRLSPIVLAGSLLSFWTFIKRKELRPDLAWLGGFCAGYLLLLALNVKRYQRYLLPTIGPLTATAALALSEMWRSKHRNRRLDLLLLVLLQLLLLLPFAAHPLTSFNPLLGGPWTGARVLSADWGEGMGAAARWLNRRPDASQLTVAASSVPPFASLFDGHTVPMECAPLADYLVRAIPQGSEPSFEHPVAYTATASFLDHALVLTNTAPLEQAAYLTEHAASDDLILLDADTPLLRRYEGPGAMLSAASVPDERGLAEWLEQKMPGHASIWRVSSPEASSITAAHLRRQLEAIATAVDTTTVADATITQYAIRNARNVSPASRYRAAFGGRLMLVDGVVPKAVAWPDALPVVVRWRAQRTPLYDYRAVVALRDDEGHAWSKAEMPVLNSVFFPTSDWQAGQWSDATYDLSLPPMVPPGRYAVEVSLYRGDTGARLGAIGPDGDFRGTRVPVGEVEVAPPEAPLDVDAIEIPERLDVAAGPLTLLGMRPPAAEVLSGDALSLALFWQADSAPQDDYRVRLCLVSPDGEIGLERLRLLSPYPTSRWRAGDRFQSRYSLRIPPDPSPGHYRLTLNVVNSKGQGLLKNPVSLASIEVLPRKRSFKLSDDIPHRLTLTFGENIRLRGYEMEKAEARPGEALALTLYWQADGPTDRSYTLFVHLLGSEGRLHGQVDRIPGDGAAPTSSWASGQAIVEDISLPVASDAPSGTYHIAIGFYDAAYGDRLPVADASGHPLGENQATLPVDITVSGDPQ